MRSLAFFSFSSVVAILSLVPPAEPPQVPTFASRTELVALEVSVMDANRRPIRELPRSAFTVLEDGKPQDISLFEEITMPAALAERRPWANEVAADVQDNEHRARRLWVFVLDDALIPTHPFAIRTSLSLTKQFIDKLSPDDLAAIVFTADSRRAQDFTNDRSRLLATLDRFHPGWADMKAPPPGFRMSPDVQFFAGVVNTFRNVIDTLALLPDQRKSVIWVSGGIDMNQPEALVVLQGMRPVFENARRANVPIYAIHPCGLMTEIDLGVNSDRCSASKTGIASLGGFAAMTGGRVIEGNNDYNGVLDPIFEENNSFYLIGYAPPAATDGRLHRTEVRADVKGAAFVRTRSGYVSPKKGAAAKTGTDALKRILESPIASANIPLKANAVPFGIANRRGFGTVAVAVSLREPLSGQASASRAVTVNIAAFTTEGQKKGETSTRAVVPIHGVSDGEVDYEVMSRLDLPSGRTRLRIAVLNEATGQTGTVMSDVTVPDFSSAPVSTSGIVISVNPRPPYGPSGFVIPTNTIPTTRREFGATDRAAAATIVYQAQNSPAQDTEVRIQLTDSRGAIFAVETRTIAANEFILQSAWRAAPIAYDLPLMRLQPGAYLLTMNVRTGQASSRVDVEFSKR